MSVQYRRAMPFLTTTPRTPAEEPGLSTWEGEFPRDMDSLLEGDRFEPSVSRKKYNRFRDIEHDLSLPRRGTEGSIPPPSCGESGELRAASVGLTTPGAQAQAMRSRSSIASTLAVPTTHALSRRALSVAARCTGVSIAPCERTANAANAIY